MFDYFFLFLFLKCISFHFVSFRSVHCLHTKRDETNEKSNGIVFNFQDNSWSSQGRLNSRILFAHVLTHTCITWTVNTGTVSVVPFFPFDCVFSQTSSVCTFFSSSSLNRFRKDTQRFEWRRSRRKKIKINCRYSHASMIFCVWNCSLHCDEDLTLRLETSIHGPPLHTCMPCIENRWVARAHNEKSNENERVVIARRRTSIFVS